MLEASDELALAQTRNRELLHPPLRRREKGQCRQEEDPDAAGPWTGAAVGATEIGVETVT